MSVRKISLPVYVFDHSRLFCTPRARVGRQQQELSMVFPTSPANSGFTADGRQISSMSTSSYVETPSPMPAPSQSGQLTLLTVTGHILQAFSSALGAPLQSLSADSDFFEEGGDSVSAVVLTAEINKRCQLAILAPQSQVRTATLLVTRSVRSWLSWCGGRWRARQADYSASQEVKTKTRPDMLVVDTSVRTGLRPSAVSPVGSFASTLRSPTAHRPHSHPCNCVALPCTTRAACPRRLLMQPARPVRARPHSGPAAPVRSAVRSAVGQLPSPYLPLVLVHAVGGDILSYRNLCAHLSPQQAVFAFRADSLDGSEAYDSIQQMAAKYLEVLQADDGPFRGYWRVRELMMRHSAAQQRRPLTPDGDMSPSHSMSFLPVVVDEMRIALGGHSFGGLVAYEMACQLQAKRHSHLPSGGSLSGSGSILEVPESSPDFPDSDSEISARGSLSDVESSPKRSESPTDLTLPICVQRLVLIDAPAPECLPPALTDAAAVNAYIQTNRIGGAAAPANDKPVQVSADVANTWLAHQKGMRDYTWPQLGAPDRQRCDEVEGTLFIRPTDRVHATGAAAGKEGAVGSVGTAFYTAWLDVASEGLTVSKVSGNHLSMMMQPHVQQVANKVSAFTAATW